MARNTAEQERGKAGEGREIEVADALEPFSRHYLCLRMRRTRRPRKWKQPSMISPFPCHWVSQPTLRLLLATSSFLISPPENSASRKEVQAETTQQDNSLAALAP